MKYMTVPGVRWQDFIQDTPIEIILDILKKDTPW